MNPCILRNKYKKQEIPVFPARIFGYLATCKKLKQNTEKVIEESIISTNNLPFVSKITNKISPEACVYIHWSFLKY